MRDLNTLLWPVSRLGEAMEALARRSGLAPRSVELPIPPQGLAQDGGETLSRWMALVASSLGCEAEPVTASYPEVEWLIKHVGPALLRIPGAGEPRFLTLLSDGRKVSVLGPDHRVYQVRLEAVRTALCRASEAPLVADLDRVLVAGWCSAMALAAGTGGYSAPAAWGNVDR